MDDKKVRFSRKNDTCLIENRLDSRNKPLFQPTSVKKYKKHSNHTIDDEVKDHPSFLKSSNTDIISTTSTSNGNKVPYMPLPPPSIINTSKIESQKMKQDLLKQLKTDVEQIVNPITHRKITRFGANYWKLLESMFGLESDIFKREKEKYKKQYKVSE